MSKNPAFTAKSSASQEAGQCDAEVDLWPELQGAKSESNSLRRRLQELEFQLDALQNASDAVQQDLLSKNSALSEKLECLEADLAQTSRFGEAGITPVDAAFHAGYTKIETKIYRRQMAFLAEEADRRIDELHGRISAAQPDPESVRAEADSWASLARLLLGTLLTTTGRVVNPVKRSRVRQTLRTLEVSGLFDKDWYLTRNPDVSGSGLDPVEHFLRYGAREGRLPSPQFEPQAPHHPTPVLPSPQTLLEVLQSDTVHPHSFLMSARADAEIVASGAQARVSVIVPTYNRATTIERALRSALEQTVTPHEIIVADDQSTDGTLALLEQSFSEPIADGRLVVLRCKKGGVCKMRNAALKRATGNVIAYLDSDNFWHPDHLLWAVAALQADGTKSIYTASNVHHLTENWSRVDSNPYDRTEILKHNIIDMNCFVHKAVLYQQLGGFDPRLTRLVDWDYILRLTKDSAPLRVPVATVEYFLDKVGLSNISYVQSLDENAGKVQYLHREEMCAAGILNDRALKKLDEVAEKMKRSNQEIESTAEHLLSPEPEKAAAEDLPSQLPYFGGMDLFIVLPGHVDPPKNLPLDYLNGRFIRFNDDWSWTERNADGSQTAPSTALPSGNYWCPDLRQPMPTSHQLATLTAATELTEIDLAIGSASMAALPTIAGACFRNQVVLRQGAVQAFLFGQRFAPETTGKVLRLQDSELPGPQMRDLTALLGQYVNYNEKTQYFTFGPDPKLAAARPGPRISQVPPIPGKSRILTLAQKFAVGGVERNTIEIARQLQDDHDCLYLALEPISAAQGSLCYQANEACLHTIDLAEIAHHEIYPQLLRHLHAAYAPDTLWICNGSMWLSANAPLIREIFSDCGIVDQQVYDTEVGWINRYQEPGVQSFDRFIAINGKIQKKFIEDFKIDPARIDLIYPSFNGQRFLDARARKVDIAAGRAAFSLPPDKTLFAFMGRLVEQKNPFDFLEVARLSAVHEDHHFAMVGNGPLAERVEAFIAEHNLTNVTRIPNIADVTTFWPLVDAYLVTSQFEGLPIAFLEAISIGVPAIATDVGDIRFVIEKYAAGHVVDEIGEPAQFYEVLQKKLPELEQWSRDLWPKGTDIINFFSAENTANLFANSFEKARQAYARKG